MNKIIIFFLLLLCCNLAAQESIVEKSRISREHLHSVLTDLILKNAFSTKSITILNSYELLTDYKFKKDGYSFAVVEKSNLNIDQANQILFWRMDVKDTSAHYEFYLNQSNDITVKFEYLFELVNRKWLIQQQ